MYGQQVPTTGYDLWTFSLFGERTKGMSSSRLAAGSIGVDRRWSLCLSIPYMVPGSSVE